MMSEETRREIDMSREEIRSIGDVCERPTCAP